MNRVMIALYDKRIINTRMSLDDAHALLKAWLEQCMDTLGIKKKVHTFKVNGLTLRGDDGDMAPFAGLSLLNLDMRYVSLVVVSEEEIKS